MKDHQLLRDNHTRRHAALARRPTRSAELISESCTKERGEGIKVKVTKAGNDQDGLKEMMSLHRSSDVRYLLGRGDWQIRPTRNVNKYEVSSR